MAMISNECAEYIASSLEDYVNTVDLCILIDHVKSKDYEKSIKIIRKEVIKPLKKGKIEDVFSSKRLEKYRDYLENEAARNKKH